MPFTSISKYFLILFSVIIICVISNYSQGEPTTLDQDLYKLAMDVLEESPIPYRCKTRGHVRFFPVVGDQVKANLCIALY